MSGDCPHCDRHIPRNLKHHIDNRCEQHPEHGIN